MFLSKKDANFSLKAVINKQKSKVLFAEIDSDFADVLLSFLTLPLGKIVRILKKHYGDEASVFGILTTLCSYTADELLRLLTWPSAKPVRILKKHSIDEAPVFGSLTTLYDGLSNLDGTHFSTKYCKKMLLDPVSSFSFTEVCCKLKLDVGDAHPTKYFSCGDLDCGYPRRNNIGMYYGTARCDCGELLKREIPVRNASDVTGEVFTKSNSTFILTDDLEILPNTTTSVRKIMGNLGLMNLDGTELRNMTFGFNEIMDLLKVSLLVNSTPLTDTVLNNHQTKCEPPPVQIKNNSRLKDEPVPVKIGNREARSGVGFIIKAILQKSTKELLFVEAGEDFVEFLFNLLTIPLGKVEYLLCGNTCLKNIDSLYRSVAFPIEGTFFRNAERSRLINPTVPFGYGSKKQIFQVDEESSPHLCYEYDYSKEEEYLSPRKIFGAFCTFRVPKGKKDYLNGPRRYMVKDDLTVTTLCMTSYISFLTEQQIPLSDVDEKMMKIGLQEASNILKASLTSTCALSNGLNHLMK